MTQADARAVLAQIRVILDTPDDSPEGTMGPVWIVGQIASLIVPTPREAYEAGYGHGYRNAAFDIGGDDAFEHEDFDDSAGDSFDIWLSERKDP
jgi:hypothetical protein